MSKPLPQEELDKKLSYNIKQWILGNKDMYVGNMEVTPQKEEIPDESVLSSHKKDRDALMERIHDTEHNKNYKLFFRFYRFVAVVCCISLLLILLLAVSYLPPIGDANNPVNNEVSAKYIEDGLQDTGAVNIVTGMILDYRAFDTFGESNVLFIATCTVLILMRNDKKKKDSQDVKSVKKITKKKNKKAKQNHKINQVNVVNTQEQNDRINPVNIQKQNNSINLVNVQEQNNSVNQINIQEENDMLYEPKPDSILKKVAFLLVPIIMIFGIYVVLNGHLSPGGGFSGGAIIGAGLILHLNAFGFEKTARFFTEKTYKWISLCSLSFYCLAKSYSFFMGANHLETGIPLGTAGDIISSGLILPLNICVGLVVACTMYTFYVMFRKGGF